MARKRKKRSSAPRKGRRIGARKMKGLPPPVAIILGLKSADTSSVLAGRLTDQITPWGVAAVQAGVGALAAFGSKNTFVQSFGAGLLYNGILTAVAQTGVLGAVGQTYRIPFRRNSMGQMKQSNIITGSNRMGQTTAPSWRGVMAGLGMAD